MQGHGFSWEKEVLVRICGATPEELREIKYTSKMDLPAHLNRLDKCDVSVKTSGSLNTVCMGDCLRVYDAVNSGIPLHMIVVHYKQTDKETKTVTCITEVDLTDSREVLFGTLTRSQIEELNNSVKAVPHKRKPTAEEHARMYAIRNELQTHSGAILLNIKCDSSQSRLQCSFHKFQHFVESNTVRIIAKSNTNEFRGGVISAQLTSPPRQRKKKQCD